MQWILGHAQLSTTQLYLPAPADEVIASVLAHHARQAERRAGPSRQLAGPSGYRAESLQVLFGKAPW